MMRNNILVLAVALLLSAGHVAAQTTTLRVDCIFSGNAEECSISLSSLSEAGPWAGRGKNMDTLLLRGNGQISLRDAESAGLLYVNSFSTLFQEWQNTEEATRTVKAFENVFLLPMPESDAVVRIELYDFRGRVSASLDFAVSPDDILIKRLEREAAPHRYIRRSGDITDKIDMAIVAEGYTAEEAGLFYEDAAAAADALFSHEPFGKYRDRINIVAVALPSADSGVSVPEDGEWKETPLHSHFSTFYMDRYLTTLNIKDLHDALAGIPYEHIIILANTDVYGGGGIYNSYTLTTAHHSQFRPVVVHEFGHSFGALADEYYYDDMYVEYYYPDVEPWEQNITTLHDFSRKWANLLDEGTPVPTPASPENIHKVGVYEGAGYQSKGVYRGYQSCRMLDNNSDSFCPVCRQAIERMILFNTEESL